MCAQISIFYQRRNGKQSRLLWIEAVYLFSSSWSDAIGEACRARGARPQREGKRGRVYLWFRYWASITDQSWNHKKNLADCYFRYKMKTSLKESDAVAVIDELTNHFVLSQSFQFLSIFIPSWTHFPLSIPLVIRFISSFIYAFEQVIYNQVEIDLNWLVFIIKVFVNFCQYVIHRDI